MSRILLSEELFRKFVEDIRNELEFLTDEQITLLLKKNKVIDARNSLSFLTDDKILALIRETDAISFTSRLNNYIKQFVSKNKTEKLNRINLDVNPDNVSENRKWKLNRVLLKENHSFEVAEDTFLTSKTLGFNLEVSHFAQLAGLEHDRGRFIQYLQIGFDADSKVPYFFPGMLDHGDLSRHSFLNDRKQENLFGPRYINSIATIIGEHARNNLSSPLNKTVRNLQIFSDYTIDEILASDCYSELLISIVVQIVRDVDKLDIYRQILKPVNPWVPLIDKEKTIPEEVFNFYYNKSFPSTEKLKKINLWNANVGELVRLSFIFDLNLVSTAQMILEENYIRRMYELRDIEKRANQLGQPELKEAFLFAENYLKEAINNSIDGKYLAHPQVLNQQKLR